MFLAHNALPRCGSRPLRCCVWPACPMRSVALPATRLLEHYRQAHGGDVPDDVLAWADGVRCSDCGMPYRRAGLAAHRRRDPIDGTLRCPALIRPEAASVLVTAADERFAASLTADQVYIGVASSLESIAAAVCHHRHSVCFRRVYGLGDMLSPRISSCQPAAGVPGSARPRSASAVGTRGPQYAVRDRVAWRSQVRFACLWLAANQRFRQSGILIGGCCCSRI